MSGKYWDKAWSLVEGCTPVSEACDNCWLAQIDYRFNRGFSSKGRFSGDIFLHSERLSIPLKTKKPTVFAVWSDLFHEAVPDEFIYRAFPVMTKASQHTFLVLTKRPERALEICTTLVDSASMLSGSVKTSLPINIYLGVTAENQEQADKRIPILLQVPAAKRFVSIEPMLGPVDLQVPHDWICQCDGCKKITGQLDLVILGGESGHKSRPMHPDWARKVRDDCEAAGVPFFFKQWGEWLDEVNIDFTTDPATALSSRNATYHVWPGGSRSYRMGFKKAGRLLDGREWNDLPWRDNETRK